MLKNLKEVNEWLNINLFSYIFQFIFWSSSLEAPHSNAIHEDPIFRSHDRAGLIGYQQVPEGHDKPRKKLFWNKVSFG